MRNFKLIENFLTNISQLNYQDLTWFLIKFIIDNYQLEKTSKKIITEYF